MTVADGSSCWICLDDGPDESGQSPQRDCSCRGDAGFAHLSCTIKYAEQRTKRSVDSGETRTQVFYSPWERCPNCKQKYQDRLALEMSSAFVSFSEKTYGYAGNDLTDQILVLVSLQHRIETITLMGDVEVDPNLRGEGRMHVEKVHSMIKTMMKEHQMGGWVHMPAPSDEFQTYKMIRATYEAFGYIHLAQYSMAENTEESSKEAIGHFRKARAIYKLFGMEGDAKVSCILKVRH